jgi:hypothetical protein
MSGAPGIHNFILQWAKERFRMKTGGNTIRIAGGKFGGGVAAALQPFGLPEAPYFVWGAIR